jgi:RNA polymerase subunit RPABC4/transcription elongation factor Spt4
MEENDEVYCTNCGKTIKAEAEICPHCGVRQMQNTPQTSPVTTESDEVYCRSCGEVIKKEAEICPHCGVRQKQKIPETSETSKSRTGEMVLGIIGGLIGIIVGVFAISVGGLAGAFGNPDASLVVGGGFGALLLGVIGIVGGAIANKNNKYGGYLMLISGLLGFIAVSAFWLISGLMLILGGILSLRD